MPLGDKYKPLTDYLLNLGKDTVSLTFRRLEEITGGLPPSVYKYPSSWLDSNTHSFSYGWHNAGYRIQADFLKQRAVFTKVKIPNSNVIKNKSDISDTSTSQTKKLSKLRVLGMDAIQNISRERIEEAFQIVMGSKSYGEETKALERIIHRFPHNIDSDDIIIKLAIVDVTHSTQLAKQKRRVNIDKLAKAIAKIPNLDSRLNLKDWYLVTEFAEFTSVDLLSIASKYCACHNQLLYGKDDYFKFDNIVSKMIGYNGRNYDEYCKILDGIVEEKDLRDVPQIRRKLDCYLWYCGRKNEIL